MKSLRPLAAIGLASALVLSAGVAGAAASPLGPPPSTKSQAARPFAGAPSEDFETACVDAVEQGVFGDAPWCVEASVLHVGPGTMGSTDYEAEVPWSSHSWGIEEIVFHGTPEAPTYAGASASSLFSDTYNLDWVTNIEAFDTSKVTDMSYMFRGSGVTELDVSRWDTSKVTDMSGMFSSASGLTELDVSRWDTSKVTDMSGMFLSASDLTELDVSNWDTSRVTNMSAMFSGASELSELDVSKWNTSRVTYMGDMFSYASSLTMLDVSNWNTSRVTSMSYMFSWTSNLATLNPSNWNTGKVDDMSSMFANATSLTSLDLSKWNTSSVYSAAGMFEGASNLKALQISAWKTSSIRYMESMFSGATSLTSLDLSAWNTSNVSDMFEMFRGASALKTLNVSGWDTSNVDRMYGMFPPSLTKLTLGAKSAFDTTSGLKGTKTPGKAAAEWTQVGTDGVAVKNTNGSLRFTGSDAALLTRSQNSAVSAGIYTTAVPKAGPTTPPPSPKPNPKPTPKPDPKPGASAVFVDTPKDHKFNKEIEWMYAKKYTTGIKTSAGLTYAPKASLTREAMAAFIYRLQDPKGFKAPNVSPFADVNPGDKFYTEITWMHAKGLSTGTKQATGKPMFAPKDGLSREAMAAFIYRLEAPKGYTAPAVSKLADMKKGDKFYTEISWMYQVKLTTGNKVGADREYWPKTTLTREAMAAFIYRLVETYRPTAK